MFSLHLSRHVISTVNLPGPGRGFWLVESHKRGGESVPWQEPLGLLLRAPLQTSLRVSHWGRPCDYSPAVAQSAAVDFASCVSLGPALQSLACCDFSLLLCSSAALT